MTTTTNIAADTAATQIFKIPVSNLEREYKMTIQIGGTFGSGTVGLLLSLDGGTTKNTMDDMFGVAYTTTAAKTINANLVAGKNQASDIIGYASVTGSTNPAIKIVVEEYSKEVV